MFSFNPIGSDKFLNWLESIKTSYDQESLDKIISNALNIGRLSLKHANEINSFEESGIKELIQTSIADVGIMDQVSTLITEIKSLGINTEGSTKKGKSAEMILRNKLQTSIPEWKFTDTSGTNSSGDIIAEKGQDRIVVEVKNYTNSVPSKEITKFYRDLDTMTPNAALFISISSGITGMGNYECEYRMCGSKRIPIIFVSHAGISCSAGIIAFLLLTKLITNEEISVINDELAIIEDSIIQKLECVVGDSVERLNIMDNEISRVRSDYAESRRKITNLLDDSYKALLTLEVSFKSEVQIICKAFNDLDFYSFATNSSEEKLKSSNIPNFISTKIQKNGYNELFSAIKEHNENNKSQQIVSFISQGEIVIKEKNNQLTIAKTCEKPQSLQLVYANLPTDGMDIAYGYEVVSASGMVYFNLNKIKNDIGREKLISRLYLLKNKNNI
jgi:hypothetical protein